MDYTEIMIETFSIFEYIVEKKVRDEGWERASKQKDFPFSPRGNEGPRDFNSVCACVFLGGFMSGRCSLLNFSHVIKGRGQTADLHSKCCLLYIF